jgi:hypothetical protein
MTDLSPPRRGPHIAVAQARVVALMGGVFGFSLTVFAVILQGLVPAIVLAIVSVLVFSLVARRLQKGAGVWGAQPSAWAQVPTYAAATAFLVYAFAIGVVHLHYYGRHVKVYGSRVRSELARTSPHNHSIEVHIQKENASLKARLAREDIRAQRMAQIARQLRPSISRHAIPVALLHQLDTLASGGITEIRASEVIERRLEKLTDELEFPKARAPQASELPPWFGRLGGFFTVGTQILAALVIALAFTGIRKSVSSQILQTAMPLAVIGIAAGIVGNLPSLGRSLPAILLGPVLAGLTGGLAALIVIALGLLDERPNRAQLILPKT